MASRRPLLLIFSVVVVDLIGFGIVIPILPYLAESLGASATVLGLMLTGYAAMQLVFAPLWGKASDRWGRRPILLFTIAGTAASLFALGVAESMVGLFLARLLGGAFAANVSVATAYVTDVTAAEERTRWMGLIGASFGIGFVLGPAIGGLLAPQGYNVPILVAAGLATMNFLVALVSLPEPERKEVGAAPGPRLRTGVLRIPAVRRLCLAYFAFSIGVSQLETVFAFYMLRRFGWDAREVAAILVLMAVIMGGVQGGGIRRLAARFGEPTLLRGGALILGLSFALVPLMPTVAVLLVPLAASSVGRGVAHPSMLSLVSSAAPEERRGAVMGTFQASSSLARVVGPAAAGVLFDLAPGAPFYLGAALMGVVWWIGRTGLSRVDTGTSGAVSHGVAEPTEP
jgi:MFS transporter, DHA1 family, tetracycline resistance protein